MSAVFDRPSLLQRIAPEESGAFVALRDRTFARYWTTLALSLTGGWVRITAMG